jgi:hypothetical protein
MSLELMVSILPAYCTRAGCAVSIFEWWILTPESSSGWQHSLIIQVMAIDSLNVSLVRPAVPQVHSKNNSVSPYNHNQHCI